MKTTNGRRLNAQQLEILELLYKFRFATRQLITDYYLTTHPGMDVFRKLKVLEERGLISKRFEPRYRLIAKPAAYYLLPAGAKALKASLEPTKAEQISTRSLYKNSTVSEAFIDHCLGIFAIYNRLKTQHGDSLKLFTKSKLSSYDYFPQPLPDAYIRLKTPAGERQYLLDIYHDKQPLFAHIRRINQYLDYAESGDWEITSTNLPVILVLCESAGLQKRLQKAIARCLNEAWGAEVVFALSSMDKFLHEDGAAWQLASDPDETLTLGK